MASQILDLFLPNSVRGCTTAGYPRRDGEEAAHVDVYLVLCTNMILVFHPIWPCDPAKAILALSAHMPCTNVCSGPNKQLST